MTTTSPVRKVKLSGVMAEHARNTASDGLVLPKIKDHMLKGFGPDLGRDPTVIHPSEMAKEDWCPRATAMRILSGKWPEDEDFDYVRENIFAAGNDIHTKWQFRMLDAGFPLWGDWVCFICGLRQRHSLMPEPVAFGPRCTGPDHMWRYDEVHMDARAELLMSGHADAAFGDTLVEIKSVGLGTLRLDAPDLLARFQDGRRIDLTGLWRAIGKPLRSHLRQGDIYLHMAHVLGMPYKQIVYLYEFKPNQMTKEFTIKYNPERIARLLAKADMVKYGVESGDLPGCIKPGECKPCKAFPAPRRRTVAGRREDHFS